MVPAVQRQRLLGFQAHADIGPAEGEVETELALPQVETIALALGDVLHARHDGAVWSCGKNPGCQAERVHVIEIRNLAGIHKALAVKGPAVAHLTGYERGLFSRQVCPGRHFLIRPAFLFRIVFRSVFAGGKISIIDPGLFPEILIQRKMQNESVLNRPIGRLGVAHPLLPRPLRPGQVSLECCVLPRRRCYLPVKFVESGFLFRGRGFDIRFVVSEFEDQAPFRNVVEVGEESIVILLGDGVEFVIVAAGATHRQAQPNRGGRLNPIGHILHPKFFVNDAAFGVGPVIPVEGRSNELVPGSVGHHVTRDLFNGELVEGHVAVEGVNHPIAPTPHIAHAVSRIPVGVAIARRIQPAHRHSLTVSRRPEETVHQVFIGMG